MKLLLDQGVSRSAVAHLRQAKLDAIHVGNIGMAEASDADILERARMEGRAVVTLDADFHALLALSGADRPSVIRFRIEGLRSREFSELLLSVISQCESDLDSGALISVQEHQIRVHRLPIH